LKSTIRIFMTSHRSLPFPSGLPVLFLAAGLAATPVHGTPPEPVDLVAPLAGTVTPRFDYFAAASMPFGMVALSPDTKHGDLWNSGYRYHDTHIQCFSHIHNIQLAGIPVMPAVGPSRGHLGMAANQARFARDTEVVRPGYHKVDLTDCGIRVEITATTRVGLSRFTFPEAGEAHLLMDLGAPIGMTGIEHAAAFRVSETELTGEVVMAPTHRRKVPCTVYFVARVDRPMSGFGGWQPDGKGSMREVEPEDSKLSGAGTGVRMSFADLQQGERIQLKVGLSYVSTAQARKNLEAELPGWDFEATAAQARAAWNSLVSRIQVEGGNEAQRAKFHTDLFRMGVGKRIWNDVDGRYTDRAGPQPVVRTLPLDAMGRPEFQLLDMDCLWGSQWNLNLLWLLAYPDVARDVARSFLEYHRHNDILPRGVWGGRDSYVMVGDPTTPLLAAMASHGFTGIDWEQAFAAARKNAFPGGVRDRSGYEAALEPTGGGMEDYIRLGYVPVEVQQKTTGWHSGGTALTLEYAWQDWCIAHLARHVDREEDAELFFGRAENFRNVFDPQSGWMRPRHADGSWMEGFKPVADDDLQSPGFIEGNSAQYTYHVPQHPAALIDLMGGREAFVARLEAGFRLAEPKGFRTPHGGHSKGWVEYGNQPSGGMAHWFNHAGAPWLSQHWVRRVHDAMFSSPAPEGGYNGDDDQGQLGALSALMAIGLFDLQGGVGENPDWEITAPIFDRVRIDLASGKRLAIHVTRGAPGDGFIQSLKFNGKRLTGVFLSSAELMQGGTLEISLGAEPVR
jgi:predicted alpha-1,2-mannosidase